MGGRKRGSADHIGHGMIWAAIHKPSTSPFLPSLPPSLPPSFPPSLPAYRALLVIIFLRSASRVMGSAEKAKPADLRPPPSKAPAAGGREEGREGGRKESDGSLVERTSNAGKRKGEKERSEEKRGRAGRREGGRYRLRP